MNCCMRARMYAYLNILQAVRALPLANPNCLYASTLYCEHVGMYLQLAGVNGDMTVFGSKRDVLDRFAGWPSGDHSQCRRTHPVEFHQANGSSCQCRVWLFLDIRCRRRRLLICTNSSPFVLPSPGAYQRLASTFLARFINTARRLQSLHRHHHQQHHRHHQFPLTTTR